LPGVCNDLLLTAGQVVASGWNLKVAIRNTYQTPPDQGLFRARYISQPANGSVVVRSSPNKKSAVYQVADLYCRRFGDSVQEHRLFPPSFRLPPRHGTRLFKLEKRLHVSCSCADRWTPRMGMDLDIKRNLRWKDVHELHPMANARRLNANANHSSKI